MRIEEEKIIAAAAVLIGVTLLAASAFAANPLQPEGHEFLATLLAGMGAAVLALATWAWYHTHNRIDGKADKEAFDSLSKQVVDHSISRDVFNEHVRSDEQQLGALTDEMKTQREHIGKIFDKIDEVKDLSVSRHLELVNLIRSMKS